MKAFGDHVMRLGANGIVIAAMWALGDEPLTPSRLFWFGMGWLVLGAIVHVAGLVLENLRGDQ